jgi:arsenate reductase-like glutaredoxin family protein
MKVIVYLDTYGKNSKKSRDWFKHHGIDFVEKDVADKKNLLEMVALTDQYAVPVFKIGSETIIGFNQEKLAKLLLG